ncbi:MAG TPA: SpoIID/LytB domain-containing protein, partial [Candidatus Obscuribacterales bacterium]
MQIELVDDQLDDDEIAAAVACVLHIFNQRRCQSQATSCKGTAEGAPAADGWKIARHLEIGGVNPDLTSYKANKAKERSLWAVAGRPLALLALMIAGTFMLASQQAAKAQDERFEPAERLQFPQPAQPAERLQSLQRAQPAERLQFSQRAQPAERLQSLQPAQPAERLQQEARDTNSKPAVVPGEFASSGNGIRQMVQNRLYASAVQAAVSRFVPSRSGVFIRVLLTASSNDSQVIALDGADVYALKSDQVVARLSPQSRWKVRMDGENLAFQGAGPLDLARSHADKLALANEGSSPPLAPAYRSSKISPVVHFAPRGGSIMRAGYFPSSLSSALRAFSLPNEDLAGALELVRIRATSGGSQANGKSKLKTNSPLLPTARPGTAQTSPPTAQAKPLTACGTGYVVVPKNSGGDAVFSYNGRLYRGLLWLVPVISQKAGAVEYGMRAINVVDLEDYLLSVLPSEMSTSWHREALKAQAIAARSYAVANLGKHAKEGYDVKDNTEDQVYLGVSSETEAGNEACAQTEGMVLTNPAG